MLSEERLAVIETRLREKFHPTVLEIRDDSAKHAGHAGAKEGAGHYVILIKASALQALSRLQSHRVIYSALQDLIPGEIHALSILVQR